MPYAKQVELKLESQNKKNFDEPRSLNIKQPHYPSKTLLTKDVHVS